MTTCLQFHCGTVYVDHVPGGILPYKRLMAMCRWMGSHFHVWIDYNGVAFSIELLELLEITRMEPKCPPRDHVPSLCFVCFLFTLQILGEMELIHIF